MTKDKKFNAVATHDKVKLFAGWLEDKQADEITALDVKGISPLAEAMVVATARNVRHAQGLADHLLERCREENIEYFGMEGYKDSEWILVDCNDVIVHLFLETTRGKYDLEGLWAKAEVLIRSRGADTLGAPDDDDE